MLCVDALEGLKVYRDEIREDEELGVVEEGKAGCDSYRAVGCDFATSGGIVALGPIQSSLMMNVTKRIAKTIMSTMMRGDDQAYTVPAHCSAMRTKMMLRMKSIWPSESRLQRSSIHDCCGRGEDGRCNTVSNMAAASAPMGRLM